MPDSKHYEAPATESLIQRVLLDAKNRKIENLQKELETRFEIETRLSQQGGQQAAKTPAQLEAATAAPVGAPAAAKPAWSFGRVLL